MYNFRQFNDRIGTAGQPTADELKQAAIEGYQDVVNIATYDPKSSLTNEPAIVEELGMSYHPIPVDWNTPQVSDFDEFCRLMNALEDRKVLVHCAANCRVTAFVSLYAMSEYGLSEADAEAFMRSVWDPDEVPAWKNLIQEIKTQLKKQT
jgi:protein tyrosine phosphatase (PTP) superfamily phosphohydrolase (DUF442 family)